MIGNPRRLNGSRRVSDPGSRGRRVSVRPDKACQLLQETHLLPGRRLGLQRLRCDLRGDGDRVREGRIS